jgi:hypothetical protein
MDPYTTAANKGHCPGARGPATEAEGRQPRTGRSETRQSGLRASEISPSSLCLNRRFRKRPVGEAPVSQSRHDDRQIRRFRRHGYPAITRTLVWRTHELQSNVTIIPGAMTGGPAARQEGFFHRVASWFQRDTDWVGHDEWGSVEPRPFRVTLYTKSHCWREVSCHSTRRLVVS